MLKACFMRQASCCSFKATSNGARASSRIVAQCAAAGGEEATRGEEMHKDPKFWALAVGLFILLSLAVVNIIEKVNMLIHLTENG